MRLAPRNKRLAPIIILILLSFYPAIPFRTSNITKDTHGNVKASLLLCI